ncbi:glycosyltransferase family 2 protein [Thalassolituus sp.]|jgi:NDP-sugar pyrophosphorylase family protein|uniref:glycosyltransferase family 2 protein n=1 Tax=Thalassolituus sp. TaxID=2030822 RepID=UPI002A81F281|nr:glycosyltransferase family 2 protein [Thalassolituus sp.]
MINLVVPMVGSSQFFDDATYKYPKPLLEINGKTMIELFIDNFRKIFQNINFIFVVNEEDCRKFHLDNILNILTENNCEVIKISNQTKGAACSVLMAIKSINNDLPLIISNSDQILDVDFSDVISSFRDVDAGVITFDSVHPRWSYVREDGKGGVVETAEKKPLSNKAIAGFYYFSKGVDFVNSAFEMIKKDASIDRNYYISPVFNELVLSNKKIKSFHIETGKYHTFYTPQKIEEYERQHHEIGTN